MVSEYVEGMKNPVVKRIPLIIKDRLIDYLYALIPQDFLLAVSNSFLSCACAEIDCEQP